MEGVGGGRDTGLRRMGQPPSHVASAISIQNSCTRPQINSRVLRIVHSVPYRLQGSPEGGNFHPKLSESQGGAFLEQN